MKIFIATQQWNLYKYFPLMRNLHSHFTVQLFKLKDPILNNSHGMEFTGVTFRYLSQEERLLKGKYSKRSIIKNLLLVAIEINFTIIFFLCQFKNLYIYRIYIAYSYTNINYEKDLSSKMKLFSKTFTYIHSYLLLPKLIYYFLFQRL